RYGFSSHLINFCSAFLFMNQNTYCFVHDLYILMPYYAHSISNVNLNDLEIKVNFIISIYFPR
ncbi:hypothetical protein BVY01_01105, partial [bacterium I07]